MWRNSHNYKRFMKKKESKKLQKILTGLELAYERMLEFKKQKKTELVIAQNGKIVKIKPETIKN